MNLIENVASAATSKMITSVFAQTHTNPNQLELRRRPGAKFPPSLAHNLACDIYANQHDSSSPEMRPNVFLAKGSRADRWRVTEAYDDY